MELNFKAEFDADNQRATITLNDVRMHMTAPQIEGLIGALSLTRAKLLPPVTDDPRGEMTAIANVDFEVQPDVNRGGVTLAARHPGMGWLYLHMTTQSARRIAGVLSTAPNAPPVQKH